MPQGLKQSFTLPVSTSRLSFVGGAVLGILISPATGTETGTAVNKNVAWQGPVLGTSLNGRIVTEAQMGLYHTGGKNPLLPDPPVFLGFPKLRGCRSHHRRHRLLSLPFQSSGGRHVVFVKQLKISFFIAGIDDGIGFPARPPRL